MRNFIAALGILFVVASVCAFSVPDRLSPVAGLTATSTQSRDVRQTKRR